MSLNQDLTSRGLVHNISCQVRFDKPITFYIGFDPTNDSLHIGSLLGIITAIRFVRAGHKAIFVIGGATGLIGDPSGKSKERVLLDKEIVKQNAKAIQNQIHSIMNNGGINSNFEFVNNNSWMEDISFLEFLRDVGKHIRVNNLLNKDSVKKRIESEEGISFTEFTYNLIQAYDFAHLANTKDCLLQLGGSDQWGNIVSGIDLSRKLFDKEVHGMTFPLLTKEDGTKFGKTEKGTIFLDKLKTSSFAFYQFLLNLTDSEALKLVKMLSFKSLEEIEFLLEEKASKRLLQNLLAQELTELVHGKTELNKAVSNSNLLFDHKADVTALSNIEFGSLMEDIPSVKLSVAHLGQPIVDSLVHAKNMFSSKTEIRNLIKGKGITVNNLLIENDKVTLSAEMLIKDQFLLIKKGKRDIVVLNFLQEEKNCDDL